MKAFSKIFSSQDLERKYFQTETLIKVIFLKESLMEKELMFGKKAISSKVNLLMG